MRIQSAFGLLLLSFILSGSLLAEAVITPFAGVWSGSLETGSIRMRLRFELATDEAGELGGRMVSVDQGGAAVPFSSASVDGAQLDLAIAAIGARFVGRLEDDVLAGTWTQGGQNFPLTLTRGQAQAEASRPQLPTPPFPYSTAEVRSAGPAGSLAGTLTIPPGAGPFPGALLISGSGAQDRDETLFGHKPFLLLADRLSRAGIAVLRFDDRGVGESAGDPTTATTADFTADAQSMLAALGARPEIDRERIVVLGHSEGALIAASIAARERLAGVVSMAGPALPGSEVLVRQVEDLARASGLAEEVVGARGRLQRELVEIAASDLPAAAAGDSLVERMRAATAGRVPDDALRAQVAPLVSPWMRYFLRFDPGPVWSQVEEPVLALWGSLDLQVAPQPNAEQLQARLPAARIRILPGLNHLFQPARTGLPTEYGEIETTLDEGLLREVTGFVVEVSAKRTPGE